MIYNMNIRVRYSECAGNGKVPIHQLLNYFQDCATFHSESIGYGIAYNRQHHKAWFLLAYDINIIRRPEMFEQLTIVTHPYKMKGFYGYRRFRISDENGETLVTADSIWILMDTESMLPSKISDEMSRAFVGDEGVDKVKIKRKIRPGKEWDEADEFDITEAYLDTNRHVNNNYYALWTENLLGQDEIRRVRIDYRKAAVLGDHVRVFRQDEEGSFVFSYVNQDGDLLAYLSVDGGRA